ncbi:MAG: hypothetical protein RLZZ184_4341 [Cyanobacteriota bacterium]
MTETLVKSITPRPVTPLGILVEELETTLKIAKQENVSDELAASLQKEKKQLLKIGVRDLMMEKQSVS